MPSHFIASVEHHVRTTMGQIVEPDINLAHDYSHVDRVRHWAVLIAATECYPHPEFVEVTALLHDIGLAYVTDRKHHAAVGAEKAQDFLRAHSLYALQDITLIAEAISAHSSLSGGGELGVILRDADMLDLFGPVGIMRAFVSQYTKPAYDPRTVKGETWGLTAVQFTERFTQGKGIGPTIMDQLNFQLSCANNLSTSTAKKLAAPLIDFTRTYILEFEAQIRYNERHI